MPANARLAAVGALSEDRGHSPSPSAYAHIIATRAKKHKSHSAGKYQIYTARQRATAFFLAISSHLPE